MQISGLNISGGLQLWPNDPYFPDPYFEYTTLLLPGNGTNNGTNNTFIDGSTNNLTITRNGNTTQGTFSPFSLTGWSNYFDGTGDYLTVADNAALQMGSGDFTIEFWMQPTSTGVATVFGKGFTGSGAILMQTLSTSGRIELWVNGSLVITESSGTYSPNNWYHIAVVRSGTSLVLYRNGVSTGSVTNSVNLNSTASLGIGGDPTNLSYTFTGYISNFRMVKGSAVYTSAFTPPTAPLTAIANTSILTCQSNRFIDNSTNNFAITLNGNTSVQSFSPFNPTSIYNSSTNGGSAYFDGTGDYLSVADSTALDLGVGQEPFTIEWWWYLDKDGAATSKFVIQRAGSSAQYQIFLNPSPGGFCFGYYNGVEVTYVISNYDATGLAAIRGRWSHYALSYNGTTFSAYINGARIHSSTITNFTKPTGTITTTIGSAGNEYFMNGFITDLRIVKGATVYNPTLTTLTVPTAPLTAISGTTFLLSNINGKIVDATSRNTFESVGNTVISTAQSKWGGSSIYFPGFPANLPASANNAQLYDLGTGDFTIECWVYFSALSTDRYIFERGSGSLTAAGRWALFWRQSGTSIAFQVDGTTVLQDSNGSRITTGQWYHVAVTRASSTARLFVDGTQVASATVSTSLNPVHAGTPSRLNLGNDAHTTSYHFNGYINDARLTRGIARYTTNFTPPTKAFPLF